MTQEEKQLLLKDLCARLPYGVRYKGDGGWGINSYQHTTAVCTILNSEEPLLYLRPMSSMTEEEKKELCSIRPYLVDRNDIVIGTQCNSFEQSSECQDWLNAHHFDYRGLIEKGLAIEAPADMYKYKEE